MLPPGTCRKNAIVCSDSEAIIKALMSPVTTSKLIEGFKETLNQTGLRNQVMLAWVPGKSGVEGNEKEDKLARLGSASSSVAPEQFIPIPHSLCESGKEMGTNSACAKGWNAYEGGKSAH